MAKDLGETCNDLGKKTRECGAIRAKAVKLKEKLATLRDAPQVSEEKIKELESRLDQIPRLLLIWRHS